MSVNQVWPDAISEPRTAGIRGNAQDLSNTSSMVRLLHLDESFHVE
jgi:hypothetical protein